MRPQAGGAGGAGLRASLLAAALGVLLQAVAAAGDASGRWLGFGRDPQHTSLSATAAQSLRRVRWTAPVDLSPPDTDVLGVHYGSPLVTAANTVVVPVKTGALDGFMVQGRNGATGALKWTQATDYTLPPYGWIPPFGPTLSADGRIYIPGAGGTVYVRDAPDLPGGRQLVQLAFYGMHAFQANPAAYQASVFINTPITADRDGNVYFGFLVLGPTPIHLSSGLARISPTGAGRWIAASQAVADPQVGMVAYNCAPALSTDSRIVYVGVSEGNSGYYDAPGYLVGLDSATLAPVYRARLKDPSDGRDAHLSPYSTASPTVGPDGDVYQGVMESYFENDDDRGWLLHFSADLRVTKTPGLFGWDTTASIVPAASVPSYHGSSAYLVLVKYNHYAGIGNGDGVNRMAVLDPNAPDVDRTRPRMRVVISVVSPTPDPFWRDYGYPDAVREWCVNSTAVDPQTRSALVNCEDGKLYRWDFTTNRLEQVVDLGPAVAEAYTPTVVGPDGTVYAINNAVLFGVGR